MANNPGMPRPKAVTALAVLSIAFGITMIVLAGIRLLTESGFVYSFFSGLTYAIGFNYIGIVLLGVLILTIGVGMLYGLKLFWYLSLALWVSDVVLTLFYNLPTAFLNIMFWLELAFIAYLLRFDVQQYFKVDIHWHL